MVLKKALSNLVLTNFNQEDSMKRVFAYLFIAVFLMGINVCVDAGDICREGNTIGTPKYDYCN